MQVLDRARSLGRAGSFRVRRLRGREKYRADYEVVASSVLRHLEFESVMDVGCANGFLLFPFQQAGKQVRGIDLSPDLLEVLPSELDPHVATGDFSEASGRFDLVCCVEVAEHIRPERSEELVEKLTELSDRWIYFSAAPPGQLGRGHINCRPLREWIDWFKAIGWSPCADMTDALHRDLERLDRAVWLRRNSILLHRTKRESA